MAIIGGFRTEKGEYYSYDDYCNNCAESRKIEGKTPHIKLKLINTTQRKGLAVSVCPECDGPALDFALKNTNKD